MQRRSVDAGSMVAVEVPLTPIRRLQRWTIQADMMVTAANSCSVGRYKSRCMQRPCVYANSMVAALDEGQDLLGYTVLILIKTGFIELQFN